MGRSGSGSRVVRSLLALLTPALLAGCGGPPRGTEDPLARRAALERLPAGEQFVSLGCAGCHAPGAPFHDRLKASVGRPLEDVVEWILNPQEAKPGTEMPTYDGLIETEEARRLAAWVQDYARTIR